MRSLHSKHVAIFGITASMTTTFVFVFSTLSPGNPREFHGTAEYDVIDGMTNKEGGDGSGLRWENQGLQMATVDPKKYLLPIGISGGGPGFQFKHFKIAAKFALYLNRTIVMTPFLRHRHRTREYLVPFQRTFDETRLAELLPVATQEEYTAQCGHEVAAVLAAPHLSVHEIGTFIHRYRVTRNMSATLLDVILPKELKIQSESDAIALFDSSVTTKCLAMHYPYNFKNWTFPGDSDLTLNVNRHVKRAPPIQAAIAYARQALCDGKPYLAFHWRNKTGEQCDIGNRAAWNDPRCAGAIENMRQYGGDKVAAAVYNVMRKYQISCLYISYVPYSEAIVTSFAKIVPSTRIYNALKTFQSLPDNLSPLMKDDFMLSLLEQEVCYRAEVFIGVQYSNWSEFIFDERDADGAISYHLDQLPGVPEEIVRLEYL
ncbi:uncharacterized protein [Ptychodera flava]|uniref:uncharacterized protein n=1 Tax=Ptychodera flava TaxID=63121 RepID=UPI003969C46E